MLVTFAWLEGYGGAHVAMLKSCGLKNVVKEVK